MNKSFIGILSCFLSGVIIGGYVFAEEITVYKYNKVPIKQPVVTANMKSGVAMYNQGNYLGAMQEFEELLKKDKYNVYAKYYLALSYAQLGKKDQANRYFSEISKSNSASYALKEYSTKAMLCSEYKTESEFKKCYAPSSSFTASGYSTTKPTAAKTAGSNKEEDEITQFIKSGKKISPEAMDKITNERLQRQLQSDLYSLQQHPQEEQPAEKPRRKRRSAAETSET